MNKKITTTIDKISSNKKVQFGIFIVVLSILSILMINIYIPENSMYFGADIYFHFRRLAASMESLSHNSYPIYLDYSAAMDFGYATKWFYPDFMLIPFAWIGNMTNIFFAYKFMIFSFTVLTGIITYKITDRIFNNSFVSIVSSILYTFALYKIQNLFVRAALGESIAMSFFPIIFLGLYEIIQGNYKKWYILSIGFCLLLFTHLLSSVLIFGTIIILCILFFNKIKKEPKRIYYLVLAGIVCLIISSAYIFPMLEMMLFNSYYYSNQSPTLWPINNKIEVTQIVQGLFNGLNSGQIFYIPNIGVILTITVITRIFVNIKKKKNNHLIKYTDTITLLGIIYLFMTLEIFPWGRFPFSGLKFIQFPWRLFAIISYIFAVSGGYYVSLLVIHKYKKVTFLGVIIALTLIMFNITNQKFEQINDKFKESEVFTPTPNESNYYHLGSLEYIPIEFPSLQAIKEKAGTVQSKNNSQISEPKRNYGTTSFDITLNTNEDILEIPRFYYKGYTATLNNKELSITKSKNGLIETRVTESGKVYIEYTGTTIQKISYYISILSILSLCIYIFMNKRKLNTQ